MKRDGFLSVKETHIYYMPLALIIHNRFKFVEE